MLDCFLQLPAFPYLHPIPPFTHCPGPNPGATVAWSSLTPYRRSTHVYAWLSCSTLFDPMGSSPGIFSARILKWLAVPFSRGILLIQRSNPSLLCLLHWQANSLPLKHLEARFQRSPERTFPQCHTTSLTQATMISRLNFPRHLLMVSDPTLPLSTGCSLPSNHSKPVSSHLKAVQELPSHNQTQVLTRV